MVNTGAKKTKAEGRVHEEVGLASVCGRSALLSSQAICGPEHCLPCVHTTPLGSPRFSEFPLPTSPATPGHKNT